MWTDRLIIICHRIIRNFMPFICNIIICKGLKPKRIIILWHSVVFMFRTASQRFWNRGCALIPVLLMDWVQWPWDKLHQRCMSTPSCITPSGNTALTDAQTGCTGQGIRIVSPFQFAAEVNTLVFELPDNLELNSMNVHWFGRGMFSVSW